LLQLAVQVVLFVLVLVHLSCVFLLDGVATFKLSSDADGTTANAARHTATNKQLLIRR